MKTSGLVFLAMDWSEAYSALEARGSHEASYWLENGR